MTPAKNRKLLITAALPYANGPIHLGHLLEFTQTDLWVRFQKMQGHEVLFICGDDTHGTAIMIEAGKKKITPEALIHDVWNSHYKDLIKFGCDLSHYGSTHSPENKDICHFIFNKALEQNQISQKDVEQLYCEYDKMFLPDRFVKGTCPKCGALDQYGDSCEVCASTYSPREMKAPYCSTCKNTPVKKTSLHLFFELEKHRDFLLNWLPEHTAREVANKMKEWFNEPLRAWDISRDGPYFGIEIPGFPNKFFYVWVDAPMGYLSGTKQYCAKNSKNFEEIWSAQSDWELHHFIGKDIVYFHTLFWPALLKTGGFRTPTSVKVHGYLTLNGQKMSKSKGTQLNAQDYLEVLPADHLRYYLASKLNTSADDMDLNLEEFAQKVNSEIVGKITNLASRGAQLINRSFAGEVSALDGAGEQLLRKFQDAGIQIAQHYENTDYAKAISQIRDLADDANKYFDDRTPWTLIKTDPLETQKILSTTLHLFRCLAIYLKPVMPEYAVKAEALFGEKTWNWDSRLLKVKGKIQVYEHLASRVDPVVIQKLKEIVAPKAEPIVVTNEVKLKPEIEIDTFDQVDLRVALIKVAEAVPKAEKLLRLVVDVGALGERQIFAGIKSAYEPESLVGRKTVIVANLKARQMKFGLSQGMVLAAGPGGKDLFILSPDSGAKPGDAVK